MTLSPMADNELAQNYSSWFGWLQWSSSSSTMLRAAEKKILSYLKTAYKGCYVDIGPVVGPADKIWTISLNQESNKTPIVLLHGFAAGVALWCNNLDSIAANRPVYAIDLLGFGRSSRPTFSSDALATEKQLIDSVEEWRKEMQLDNLILLGHSLGGFLAASYAIHYPDRVKHLILADPWGFPEKPPDYAHRYNIPIWVKAVVYALRPFNPLWPVRAAGPFGQWVVEKVRPDITKKFSDVLSDDVNLIPQYIFQCNAQTPTGEAAFRTLMSSFGWAKNPMINRIHELRSDIPITLIYGSRSWVDTSSGETVSEKRPNSYVNIQIISGAGHHVYADRADIFNQHVNEVCKLADEGEIRKKYLKTSPVNADIEAEISNTESDENISAISDSVISDSDRVSQTPARQTT